MNPLKMKVDYRVYNEELAIVFVVYFRSSQEFQRRHRSDYVSFFSFFFLDLLSVSHASLKRTFFFVVCMTPKIEMIQSEV